MVRTSEKAPNSPVQGRKAERQRRRDEGGRDRGRERGRQRGKEGEMEGEMEGGWTGRMEGGWMGRRETAAGEPGGNARRASHRTSTGTDRLVRTCCRALSTRPGLGCTRGGRVRSPGEAWSGLVKRRRWTKIQDGGRSQVSPLLLLLLQEPPRQLTTKTRATVGTGGNPGFEGHRVVGS